jgi:hypothetical protein
MIFSTIIGTLGVSLLLLAFALNLFKIVSQDSWVYAILNIAGAGLSCYASILIQYRPFIVLEAAWCLVALLSFVKKPKPS